MEVHLNGVVFAEGVQRMMVSQGDVHGLMFGQVSKHSRQQLGDGSQPMAQLHNVFCGVQMFAFCDSNSRLFDAAGKVNKTTVEEITSQYPEPPIGWFSFRRDTSLRPSLREAWAHANLYKHFRKAPADFVFGVFTSSLPSGSPVSHAFDFCFYSMSWTGAFESLACKVHQVAPCNESVYKNFSLDWSGYSTESGELRARSASALDVAASTRSACGFLAQRISELTNQLQEDEARLQQLEAALQAATHAEAAQAQPRSALPSRQQEQRHQQGQRGDQDEPAAQALGPTAHAHAAAAQHLTLASEMQSMSVLHSESSDTSDDDGTGDHHDHHEQWQSPSSPLVGTAAKHEGSDDDRKRKASRAAAANQTPSPQPQSPELTPERIDTPEKSQGGFDSLSRSPLLFDQDADHTTDGSDG